MHTKSDIVDYLKDHDFAEPLFDDARNDKDIAFIAIDKDPEAYALLSWDLQNDHEIIQNTLEKDANCLQFVPKELRLKDKFISLALKACKGIANAPDSIKNNKDIAMHLVEKNGKLIKYFPRFYYDPDVVGKAVNNS